jgi:hypothetical protein
VSDPAAQGPAAQGKDLAPVQSVPEQEQSRLERTATTIVTRLVDAGIDGVGPLDPAADAAEAARAAAGSTEDAIERLVATHLKLAAAGGFVTGLGGFVTLPVALPANVAGFYGIATRLVAGIAHLRGYDVTQPEVRTAVLLTLVGADSRSILAKGGISPVGKISDLALQRLPGPALMVINKGIGFNLLSQLGRKGLSRLGRGLPLAGGVIGGGLDYWLLRRIAQNARDEFVQR